jgi:hypothetical protein
MAIVVTNMPTKQTMLPGLVTTDIIITVDRLHVKGMIRLNIVGPSEQGRLIPMQVQDIIADITATQNHHQDADVILNLGKDEGGVGGHPVVNLLGVLDDIQHDTVKPTSAGRHLIEEEMITGNDGIDGILPIAVVAAAVHQG